MTFCGVFSWAYLNIWRLRIYSLDKKWKKFSFIAQYLQKKYYKIFLSTFYYLQGVFLYFSFFFNSSNKQKIIKIYILIMYKNISRKIFQNRVRYFTNEQNSRDRFQIQFYVFFLATLWSTKFTFSLPRNNIFWWMWCKSDTSAFFTIARMKKDSTLQTEPLRWIEQWLEQTRTETNKKSLRSMTFQKRCLKTREKGLRTKETSGTD